MVNVHKNYSYNPIITLNTTCVFNYTRGDKFISQLTPSHVFYAFLSTCVGVIRTLELLVPTSFYHTYVYVTYKLLPVQQPSVACYVTYVVMARNYVKLQKVKICRLRRKTTWTHPDQRLNRFTHVVTCDLRTNVIWGNFLGVIETKKQVTTLWSNVNWYSCTTFKSILLPRALIQCIAIKCITCFDHEPLSGYEA